MVNKFVKEDDFDFCFFFIFVEDLLEVERSNLEIEDVCIENELFGWGEDENNKGI